MIPLLLAASWAADPEPPPTSIVLEPPDEPSVDEVLAAFEHEPSVAEVQEWASRHAQTSPGQIRRWLRQSRSFAALPRATVEWRLADGDDQRFDYFDADGAALRPGAPSFGVIDQATAGRDVTYRLRLDWDLADLVMSSERIRVLDEVQDLVELRAEVLEQVTALYFERRRLQVERTLQGPVDPHRAVRDELRLRELTARIDALTGGAFSAAMARPGR